MKKNNHRDPLSSTAPNMFPRANLLKYMGCLDNPTNPDQCKKAQTVQKFTSDARWEYFMKFLAEDVPYDQDGDSTVK